MRARLLISTVAVTLVLAGCANTPYPKDGVRPSFSFPVSNNDTPYSQCLTALSQFPGNHLPRFTVGEVSDKTGKFNQNQDGYVLSQGVSEMVMSALYKTQKAHLVERYDLRIPLAELKMASQKLTTSQPQDYKIQASDFVVIGALTELNYNITSGGIGLWVSGIGAGMRTAVINVALDLRVVDSKTFQIRYVTSLQKQIYGYEVEANVFRFFGTQLVEFDAGQIKNEPLQLGVRSVVEMGIYQVMTDFLKLPKAPNCGLTVTDHMSSYLKEISK